MTTNRNNNNTTGERLARIETNLEHTMHQSENNGKRAEQILNLLLDKIDHLDAKIESRFNKIEERASLDEKELAKLRDKGVAVLMTLGAVFTFIATVFSNFFTSLKHAIFG